MLVWSARRPCKDDEGFLTSLQSLGVSVREWDVLAPQVETLLCGGTHDSLNSLFPAGSGGVRVVQVMPHSRPSFVVAFVLADVGQPNEHILYLRGARF